MIFVERKSSPFWDLVSFILIITCIIFLSPPLFQIIQSTMLQNLKCLTEPLAIILVSLCLLDFSECKPQFGLENVIDAPANNDALLVDPDKHSEDTGERNEVTTDLEDLKRAWNSNFAAWGKKRWGNFASWGKRSSPSEYAIVSADGLHPVEKRGWFKFNSWGKRSVDDKEDDKRKWSSFASWGKRDDENVDLNPEKRKWSNFASWGKRDDENIDLSPEKRKWSSFASWGKRYTNDEKDLDSIQDSDMLEADKRKWSKFASWGKRDLELSEPDKRKWSSFASWGKRDDLENSPEKRRWSQFNSWGKRRPNPYEWAKRRWAQFNSWGKRKWTGLATWGKRSAPGIEGDSIADSIVMKLLQFFDTNGMYFDALHY